MTLSSSNFCVSSINQNCISEENLICRHCSSNFSQNLFDFKLSLYKEEYTPNFAYFLSFIADKDDFLYRSQCSSVLKDNCKKLSFNNTCVECEDLHYISNEGKCLPIGDSYEIPHCQYYKATTLCSKCVDGFHLNPDFKGCLINDLIPNCEDYLGFAVTTTCETCKTNYNLVNHSCVHLTLMKSLENCVLFNSVFSRCDQCAQGHRLSDDQALCVKGIALCKVYQMYFANQNQGSFEILFILNIV